MKSVKSILIATILLCSSVASSVSAQQGAQGASYEFGVWYGIRCTRCASWAQPSTRTEYC